VLLIVAVVLGIVLLNHFDKGDPYANVSAGANNTVTTRAPRGATTTLPPTTTTPLRAPGAIKVLPANGSGVQGAGARLKTLLTTDGYNALAATNATPANKVYATSLVEYAPGLAGEAKALAQTLGLADTAVQPLSTPPPVADTLGADMVVVLGQDLTGRLPAATSTATTAVKKTTATTVHATTTTKKPAATTTTKA
jgi:hypothetical protein